MAWLLGRLLVVVIVLGTGGVPVAAQTETTALLCQSNETTGIGYYNAEIANAKTAKKVSGPLERQPNTSQWRIDLLPTPTSARVTRYSGTLQQIDVPASLWRVETDPMGVGLLLFPTERAPGTSMEVITITVATGAFVYSTQHVNPVWNRASVWVGQCYRAP